MFHGISTHLPPDVVLHSNCLVFQMAPDMFRDFFLTLQIIHQHDQEYVQLDHHWLGTFLCGRAGSCASSETCGCLKKRKIA